MDVQGLTGWRPTAHSVSRVVSPPYDVIDDNLFNLLNSEEDSLAHVLLGNDPVDSFHQLISKGRLVNEEDPCFYILKQESDNYSRTGVFCAPKVYDYEEGQVKRHEKTFDEKVKGRMQLRKDTGYSFGPVFCVNKEEGLGKILDTIAADNIPFFEFTPSLNGLSDLDGVQHQVYRVLAGSVSGWRIKENLEQDSIYIADGHHRYHTALRLEQERFLAYVCPADRTKILAYDRLIKTEVDINEFMNELGAVKVEEFKTPDEEHSFCVYTREGVFEFRLDEKIDDCVDKLDVARLEKFYPRLGLEDNQSFGFKPETQLDVMQELVNREEYDMAVALYPVSAYDVMTIADAKRMMPRKATWFDGKLPSGIIIPSIN